MCGDDIILNQDQTNGVCESCGTTTTLPKINEEQLVNLYNRANNFRRQNKFDNAIKIYEDIIREDDTQAEAHWGMVLCRYGIEYVVDPVSSERIPTCHRASYDDILKDVDYTEALKYTTDMVTRSLYEKEAKYISKIQKEIVSLSQQKDPYDVFICYKETDETGNRTEDSVVAQEIYYQLTNQGYKVFFARITLEGILGEDYESYIFAALHTSKVMLVIGTKEEHFNAVWVKNEWSRYLEIVKKDRKKLLIPCYKNMDAYDIPDELARLQSQDMSKIGFIQDLIRAIDKKLKVEIPKETISKEVTSNVGDVDSLYKRGCLFLEDKDFENAKDYFNKCLDKNPEHAPSYIGLVCAKFCISRESNLVTAEDRFWRDSDFKKAVRFADEKYKKDLEKYELEAKSLLCRRLKAKVQSSPLKYYYEANRELNLMPYYQEGIKVKVECKALYDEALYQNALLDIKKDTLDGYRDARAQFVKLGDYKDSKDQINNCQNRINEILAEEKYQRALNLKEDILSHGEALALFESIAYYKDSAMHATELQEKKAEIDSYAILLSEFNNATKGVEFKELGEKLQQYRHMKDAELFIGYCAQLQKYDDVTDEMSSIIDYMNRTKSTMSINKSKYRSFDVLINSPMAKKVIYEKQIRELFKGSVFSNLAVVFILLIFLFDIFMLVGLFIVFSVALKGLLFSIPFFVVNSMVFLSEESIQVLHKRIYQLSKDDIKKNKSLVLDVLKYYHLDYRLYLTEDIDESLDLA